MTEILDQVAVTLRDEAVYTMRQLNQDTAGVIAEINRSGRPAAITKHGRFVALIQPLEGAQIETKVLTDAGVGQVLAERAAEKDPKKWSSDEVWGMLEMGSDSDT